MFDKMNLDIIDKIVNKLCFNDSMKFLVYLSNLNSSPICINCKNLSENKQNFNLKKYSSIFIHKKIAVNIDPNLNISLMYAARLFLASIVTDWKLCHEKSFKLATEIVLYRFCQFSGSYIGSRASKKRIARMKAEYFYPKASINVIKLGTSHENNSSSTNESAQ